jgi:hypothetical protein
MGTTRSITAGLGIVAALLLSACGTQVAGAGAPPVLHIGNQGKGIAALDAAPAAATAVRGGASTDASPYPLKGTLPTGPSSAPAYRYGDAQVAESRVSALASALGISGSPKRHAHGWEVASSVGILQVRDGAGQWAFVRAGAQCPIYSIDIDNPDGAVSGVGCAVATDVAVPPVDNVAPLPFGQCTGGPAVDCPAANPSCGPTASCVCADGTSACRDGVNPGTDTSCLANPSQPCPVGSGAPPGEPCASVAAQPGVVTCTEPSAVSGSGSAPSAGPSTATKPSTTTTLPSPTPAPVLPSDADARAAAAAVLSAVGLDGASANVVNIGVARDVSVDPQVGGLPTQGVRTDVAVDTDGIVGATGWLGEAVAGASYPLLTATEALDRLRAMPRPEIAIACVAGAECPTGIPTPTITGATLGLSLRWDGLGTSGTEVLVPSWFFTVQDSTEPLPMIAVQDAYLGDPTTDPGAGASSPGNPGVEPGSSGGGSADPGTPVDPASPPASDQPLPGKPSTGVETHPVEVTSVTLGKDGSTLVLHGFGGICEDFVGSAKETATGITVLIEGASNQPPDKACPAIAKEITVGVRLAAPWDKRPITDATTGQVVPVA